MLKKYTVEKKFKKKLRRKFRKNFLKVLFLYVPIILGIFYYSFIAENMYISKANFIIEANSKKQADASSIFAGTPFGAGSKNALIVQDYILSYDILQKLDRKFNLREKYSYPNGDFLSRVYGWMNNEWYLFYYQTLVSVEVDQYSGLVSIEYKAFTPEDAKLILTEILAISEDLVDKLSLKAREDTLEFAEAELKRAEQRVAKARAKLNHFKEHKKDLDPSRSAQGLFKIYAGLQEELVKAKAKMSELATFMQPDSNKMQTLKNKIDAIEGQIEEVKAKLVGNDDSLGISLPQFERLILDVEFAEKAYASALQGLEIARIDANLRHNYLYSFIPPTDAEDFLYPRRILSVFVILILSSLLYGIALLVISSVKEHMSF